MQILKPNVMSPNPNQVGSSPEQTNELTKYFRMIKRNKWGIMAITLVCLIIGGLVAYFSTPAYLATAKILADPLPPKSSPNEQARAQPVVALFYETQYEIIQSRRILELVVDRLDLVEKYKVELEASKNDGLLGLDSIKKVTNEKLLPMIGKGGSSDEIPYTDAQIKSKLASSIRENLVVAGGRQSKVINLSFSSESPEQAAEIVNAITDAYIQFGLESRLGEVKQTETWLSEQANTLRENLRAAEQKLQNFRSSGKLGDTNQQQILANNQMQTLNQELIKAQTLLSAAEEQYLLVQGVKQRGGSLSSIGPVLQNATTNDMVQEVARLRLRVDELENRYGDKHPTMIAARSELRSSEQSLQKEVNKVVEAIEKEYRLAQLQVSNITKLINSTRNDIQSVQGELLELTNLEREVENARRIFESFQSQLMEANTSSEFNASNIQVIDKATVPTKPYEPNIKLILATSAIAGIFLGIVMAFVRDILDSTVKTPEAMEERLNLPTLGIMPAVSDLKKDGRPERHYQSHPRSTFAESINTIRTGLLFTNIDNPPKAILVTSSNGSEGKSTLSMNLAYAFSQLGRTLLLEVDLRKPSIARSAGLSNLHGLSDLTTGAVKSFEGLIHYENNKKLAILPCGNIPRNPMELLSSKQFERILYSLKENFDHIILDAPPVLPVSDVCVLGNHVDGVIFAVKANETKFNFVKEAVYRLKKLNVNILGTVLTVAEPKTLKDHGNEYYGAKYYGSTPEATVI